MAEFHIVVTCEGESDDVRAFIADQTDEKTQVDYHSENRFEYFGIKKAYDLGCANPDAAIAYFHTKGMSYGETGRNLAERALTAGTFQNWKRILDAFAGNAGIDKIGLFPAEDEIASKGFHWGGWIWFNFWWARGSYLASIDAPAVHPHRHYYESWLGGHVSRPRIGGCVSALDFTETYYSPTEAVSGLRRSYKAIANIDEHKYPLIGPTRPDNIARDAAFIQSSNYHDSGVKNLSHVTSQDKTGYYSFHTALERDPWVLLDFGAERDVSRIVLWNRLDGASRNRSRTISVHSSTDLVSWSEIFRHHGTAFGGADGSPLTIDAPGTRLRFLRLQLNEKNYFHLDQIEVLP